MSVKALMTADDVYAAQLIAAAEEEKRLGPARYGRQETKMMLDGTDIEGVDELLRLLQRHWRGEVPPGARSHMRLNVHRTVLAGLTALVGEAERRGIAVKRGDAVRCMASMRAPLSHADGIVLRRLWADPGIKLVRDAGVPLWTTHFCSQISVVTAAGYVPSEMDIDRLPRSQISSVVLRSVDMAGGTLLLGDVTHMRTKRKKWLHLFGDDFLVVYVLSLTQYCERRPDGTTELHETMSLLRELRRELPRVPFLVFVTGLDKLAEKLKKAPLRDYFPEYAGPAGAAGAHGFVRDLIDDAAFAWQLLYVVTGLDDPLQKLFDAKVRACLAKLT